MTSTINPNVPIPNTDLDAVQVQQNFLAAYNDINGIQTILAGLGNMSTQSQNNVTITGGTLAGNGAGLTNLTPANISSGTAGIDITGNAGTVTTINGKIAPGTNIAITGSGTSVSPYTISTSGGTGSVTSVAVTADSFFLNASGSPITGAGTITLSDAVHPAFTLIGNPTGSIGVPTDIELAGTLIFSGDELHTAAFSGDITTPTNSFVTSIVTGAVTTSKIAAHAVTNAKMATGPINSLAGYDGSGNFNDVSVGSGLSLSGGILSSTGASGVTSLNGETGAITLVAGSNITITPSGTNITIASTASGGTPGGIHYDVQLNDGAGGFAGSNDLNFQGGYLTINGDSGYGQLQWLNSPLTGGYAGSGISGTDNEIIVGALAGDMTFWSSQAMNFSADTGNTNMLRINVDGGIVAGAATGGSEGAGTINAEGLYINGVAVSAGGTPGGSNMQIQFNDSGVFGGAEAVYFDKSTDYFGAGLLDTGTLTLSHPFQVGGGNSYLAPTSISGAITYYTPPAAPATGSATANYSQLLPDSSGFTSDNQVDIGGPTVGYYTADGTVNLNYYIAGYNIIAGERQYSSGSTTVNFVDNSDGNAFYVDLAWASIPGATGYVIWRNGTYNGNTASFESIDLAAATTLQDTGFAFWGSTIAHPPVPQNLTYAATGQTINYRVYDYTVPVGSIKLFSTTFKQIDFTDDNRSQHPPASGTIGYTAGVGTYQSSSSLTHSYYIWSQYTDGGFSSTQLAKSLNVPNVTIGQPASFTATQNGAESGYTANGYSGTYYIRSYKSTPAGYVYSGTAAVGFTDDSSGLPYGVDLAWPAVAGADGYIIYLNGGEYGLTFSSINVGNVTSYADQAGSWAATYPFSQNQPSSLNATQNDAETGYTADGTNIFTYNLAAYWNTPLGRIYSAPSGCVTGFTDNSDFSTFGIDLSWTPASTDPNGTNPDGYELWVVGGAHALNTAQDVGNTTSFIDQNNTWGTLNYQPSGSSAYSFVYEINLSWASVPTITAYYITKAGGDSGWSYNFEITTASLSITDIDDSVWTGGAMNPPTPVELNTFYNLGVSYASVTGSPTYRVLRQVDGGGYGTAHDFVTTSFVDNDASFAWTGPTTIANTLYHATGATQAVKAYSYDNADAIYSSGHADNSVTDNNSGNYYSVNWTASNYPSGVDKLKFIINTTNGELLVSPTLSYVDVNQSYNSDTVVTPNSVSTLFYSDRFGHVNVDTLTASTYVTTPKIGTNTGLMSLGTGSGASGTGGISIGDGAAQSGNYGIAIGAATVANGAAAISIGANSQASGGDTIAIGDGATASNSGLAIGIGAAASGQSVIAIGPGAIASNFDSGSFGFGAHASGNSAYAFGFGANASGDQSLALSYQAAASGQGSIAIGQVSAASNTNSIAIGRNNICNGQNGISLGTSATAGSFGFAAGYVATASGGTDIAIGFGANSSGNAATVIGVSSNITANFGLALGYFNRVSGLNGAAVGFSNQSKSQNASAFGASNLIDTSSSASVILGTSCTITTASASAAIGYNNSITSSNNSFIFGQGNTISSGATPAYLIGQGNSTSAANSWCIGIGLSGQANTMIIGNGSVGNAIYISQSLQRNGVNQSTPGFAWDVHGVINTDNSLRIAGSSSGAVSINTAAAAGSWTMTVPTTGGSANQFLQTNGSGVTSWADATANIICFEGDVATYQDNVITY